MAEFHETRMGRQFYERTLPELVEQVRRLAEAVERVVELGQQQRREPPSS